MKTLSTILGALLCLSLLGCTAPSSEETADASAALTPADVLGSWRAVLASPGGELPFGLEIAAEGEALTAFLINGAERLEVSSLALDGQRLTIALDWYDATLELEAAAEGRFEGRWRKTVPAGESSLAASLVRDDPRRFLPLAETGLSPVIDAPESVAGRWRMLFTDSGGEDLAQGEFTQEGERVIGTILTATGDYRFLEGSYEGGQLRLSTFDAAHAFLFTATADGEHLIGDFYSRDTYHATFIAEPMGSDEADVLPDPWAEVALSNDEGRFRFAFPGLDGELLSSDDPRFAGKVVLVCVFGSWCPNCNDEAPVLQELNSRYRDEGLEVVGLAFEFTGDTERDRSQLERFRARHGIDYPLLLAGTNDKKVAGEILQDLDVIKSYPTTILIGRDGLVRGIHSGFAGPGTGEHYERLVADLEGKVRQALAEY